MRKYADSGLLLDLYGLMNADPEFHKEKYYSNLFEACETGGRLYGMPLHPSVEVYFFNKRITDAVGWDDTKIKSVDYRQLFELYFKAIEQGALDPEKIDLIYKNEVSKAYFLNWEITEFIDWEKKTASFDTPAFMEYLEITGAYEMATPVILGGGNGFVGGAMNTPDAMNNYLAMRQNIYEHSLQVLDYSSETMTGPVRFAATSGKPEVHASMVSVHRSTPNKELAWDFLKFCMDGGKPGTFYILPLNRERFKEQFASMKQDRYFEFVDEALSTAEIVYEEPPFLMEQSVIDILSQYYDSGLITAEDCAKQLQEKVEIMMRE